MTTAAEIYYQSVDGYSQAGEHVLRYQYEIYILPAAPARQRPGQFPITIHRPGISTRPTREPYILTLFY